MKPRWTEVTEFVRENIERLLGFTPEIFPVSSLLAQQAKALGDRNPQERERLWEASRFGPLEDYIFATLDQEGRIRLKLLSPLGVAERLARSTSRSPTSGWRFCATMSRRSTTSSANWSPIRTTCAASSAIT